MFERELPVDVSRDGSASLVRQRDAPRDVRLNSDDPAEAIRSERDTLDSSERNRRSGVELTCS